jgi:hypothetical protein
VRFLMSVAVGALVVGTAAPIRAQVRGVYPLGMSATQSGVTPRPGFTYVNVFLFYSRSDLRDDEGRVTATGENAVLMDMNSFVWVSSGTLSALGGARYSASATLPVSNNSLASDTHGLQNAGGGFADSYYQPLILAWTTPRADLRAAGGFLAPTGRFQAGAPDNVGSGYWTWVGSSGQTFYLDGDKSTALSAFQMYEFHGTQEGTGIHPGQTFDLDGSLMRAIATQPDLRVQLGLVGYAQWQTTARTGLTVTAAQEAERYRVHALGVGATVALPLRQVALAARYFRELGNRSTFQGDSLQISGSLTF